MSELTRSYKKLLYARLKDPAQAAGYINTVLDEGDVEDFLVAMRCVAEARGMTRVAATAGLNRVNVYRMLSDQGNPRLSSLLALFGALGLRMTAEPIAEKASELTTAATTESPAGPYHGLRLINGGQLSTNEWDVARTGQAA